MKKKKRLVGRRGGETKCTAGRRGRDEEEEGQRKGKKIMTGRKS